MGYGIRMPIKIRDPLWYYVKGVTLITPFRVIAPPTVRNALAIWHSIESSYYFHTLWHHILPRRYHGNIQSNQGRFIEKHRDNRSGNGVVTLKHLLCMYIQVPLLVAEELTRSLNGDIERLCLPPGVIQGSGDNTIFRRKSCRLVDRK